MTAVIHSTIGKLVRLDRHRYKLDGNVFLKGTHILRPRPVLSPRSARLFLQRRKGKTAIEKDFLGSRRIFSAKAAGAEQNEPTKKTPRPFKRDAAFPAWKHQLSSFIIFIPCYFRTKILEHHIRCIKQARFSYTYLYRLIFFKYKPISSSKL